MPRFIAPDNGVKQVQVEGARTGLKHTISRDNKGFFVAEGSDAKALKAEGFVEASLSGIARKSDGFICTDCGFNCWFNKCGRCGADAVRASNG